MKSPNMLFLILVICSLATLLPAQDPTYEYVGNNAMDMVGAAVDGIGDVNFDGYSDYVIGSPGVDSAAIDAGQIMVCSGFDGSILFTLDGNAAGDQFGYSVAGVGDVNGDSIPDIIVGAIGASTNGINSGAATVFSGLNGAFIRIFLGDSADDQFGFSVSGAGDINGDGVPDLIIGAPGDDNNGMDSGSARVVSGFDGTVVYSFDGSAASDAFGTSVSGAGDVDGDNRADVVVGSPWSSLGGYFAGAAYVYSGNDGSLIHGLSSNQVGSRFGISVSTAGDANGDGFSDLIVGAPYEDIYDGLGGIVAGSAQIFSGQTGALMHRFVGDEVSLRLGTSVCDAGDVNGDGFGDVAVGAPFASHRSLPTTGSVRVYSGLDGSILKVLSGSSSFAKLGRSVAGAGDIDGDGLDDIIAGSSWAEDNGSMSGTVSVFSGNEFGPMYGHSIYDGFGWSAASAGDVDNDGVGDFVVGANDFISGGKVRLTSGQDGRILWEINGQGLSLGLGNTVCGIGDVNGDGHVDVATGAITWAPGLPGYGAVLILSGIDGTVVQLIQGDCPTDSFGHAVANAGDVNGDGVTDLIVGAFTDTALAQDSGSATVFSGADWSVLYSVLGDQPSMALGKSVAGVGDVQGDGFDDLIVGAPGDSTNGANAGGARIYSGVDGSLVFDLKGDSPGDAFGSCVAGLGDVNNDGFSDFVVGAPYSDANGTDSGQASVFSGVDSTLLFKIDGASAGEYFGYSVGGIGDVNGDGFDDFIVGAGLGKSSGVPVGSATVFSGLDGAVLASHFGKAAYDHFGGTVNSAGDFNQDGFADILVGAYSASEHGSSSGSATVFLSETLPVLNYSSDKAESDLDLYWIPSQNVYSTVGILLCLGATPGGAGIVAASLAPADSVMYGIPILIAIDPANLIHSSSFVFGSVGEKAFGNVMRQNPYLAGSLLHIQFYQSFPAIRSSNAIRLAIVP